MKKISVKRQNRRDEISKLILRIVKQSDKKGIWISELRRKLEEDGIKLSWFGVKYYVFGQKIGEKEYGGWLKDEIVIANKEGRNIMLKIKS
jgi:hypothetical protein